MRAIGWAIDVLCQALGWYPCDDLEFLPRLVAGFDNGLYMVFSHEMRLCADAWGDITATCMKLKASFASSRKLRFVWSTAYQYAQKCFESMFSSILDCKCFLAIRSRLRGKHCA